jgi:hypothetical protein
VTKSLFAVSWLLGTVMVTVSSSLSASELRMPSDLNYGVGTPVYCGPCGCLRVVYAYHPKLRSTYGVGFDPRNYDTTEPHYYLGRIRAYPRYYIDGLPAGGGC